MGGFNSMQPEIPDLRLTKMIHQEYLEIGIDSGENHPNFTLPYIFFTS